MKMQKDRFMEIVRFCVVGGLSLIVDCAILFLLTDFFGVHYLYSAGISFTVSVIFNYWFKLQSKPQFLSAQVLQGSA